MKRMPGRRRDYSPVLWSQYFGVKKDVQIDGNTFRVYIKESEAAEDDDSMPSEPVPVLVLLHGGGFSALTWALFAECVTSQVQCYVMAIDLRGHGDTHTTDDLDLSADTLSSDVIAVIDAVLGEKDDVNSHPLILIGHSMGGAIAVHAATKIVNSDYKDSGGVVVGDSDDVMPESPQCEQQGGSDEESKEPASPGEEDNVEYKYDGAYDSSDQDFQTRKNYNLCGVAVIDVVEGTAMDALAGMQSLLRSRPQKFPSLPNAIEWCVRSGQVRNVESARVSMPGQIKNAKTGQTATNDVDSLQNQSFDEASSNDGNANPESGSRLSTDMDDAIREEEEGEGNDSKLPESFKKPLPLMQSPPKSGYEWRIDLGRTEVFWPGWFQGLSAAFLVLPVPKLLLLAGIDRLDKALTVGQMQGKFQMQVLPKCGHAVHEDVPDKVADVLSTFLVRHKFAAPLANFNRTFPAC
ncbi:protein phosphatase methylesterase 1 isoform X2 [Ischnura elegans]|nr:protein phosphatase methylesterase 1 isoform X2 [Ischnura elegans]XP_046406611.1 protein phosphatase methylesterase 1 isoform X2 [Ischnura elegans]